MANDTCWPIRLYVRDDAPILLSAEEVYEVDRDRQVYPGPYEAIPEVNAQTLPTKDYVMIDDVTVHAIPYAETSNTYGTTVTIAS